MTDSRVQAIFEEFGVEVIPAHRYPEIGQTRAVKTVERIIRRNDEDHARWVVRTLAESANNKALLDETGLWAASDLVRAYWRDLQADPEAWFQVWDTVPVGKRQWEIQQRLSGIVNQRAALAGVMNKHLYERFDAPQPELPLERGQ
jgi:hypothetical protein